MTGAGGAAEQRVQLKPVFRDGLASLDHLPIQLEDPTRGQLRKQLQQTASELLLGGDLSELARRLLMNSVRTSTTRAVLSRIAL